MTVLLAALAVGAGAVVQAATGFGFAIVAAPALVALVGPQATVGSLTLLALVVNGLTLAGEGRRPHPCTGDAAALVAWALPGLAVGALALARLPDRVLEAAVGAAVLGALGVRLLVGRGGLPPRPARRPARAATTGRPPAGRAGGGRRVLGRAAAGGLSGALGTSTGLSGPPLVLFLTGRSLEAGQLRDTLATVFLALGALGLAVLALAGALSLPEGTPVLVAAAAAGQLAGRRAFAALRGADRLEPALLAVLAVAGLAAVAGGLR